MIIDDFGTRYEIRRDGRPSQGSIVNHQVIRGQHIYFLSCHLGLRPAFFGRTIRPSVFSIRSRNEAPPNSRPVCSNSGLTRISASSWPARWTAALDHRQRHGTRHRDQMDVVGHQTVRPYLHAAAATPFGQQFQICDVVLAREERRQPPMATLRDPVRSAQQRFAANRSIPTL